MTFTDAMQVFFYFLVLLALTPMLGSFMARIFEGERTFLAPVFGPLEKLTYRAAGVDEKVEMSWRDYAKALIAFNALGFIVLFLMQLFQSKLPMNPQQLGNVSWHSAFNTAISFMTNTNWQGYAGETTMSYFTQMVGLTVQNFVSAATGICVFLALTRGIARKASSTLGNFWVDLTRATVFVLLPLSVVFAVVLISQGVAQNFHPYIEATTVEGAKQLLPFGPAASQIAIKQLGTNGGGFFNANSAHPFENPNAVTNFLEMLAILLIPAALTFVYGRMVKSSRQGWLLFGVMFATLVLVLAGSIWSEYSLNSIFQQRGIMEGKEARFGVINSVQWSTYTTLASSGSVNAMHSSLSPLAGGLAMFNIMLGEVIFGGVGAGMYGMLLFVLLTVFLAGLMVGRTPEYLGKKIEAKEMKMVILAVLAPCGVILIGSGISEILPVALSSLSSKGPHGLSEILYAFSSAAGNNGSAFAGLNANTVYYNVVLGFAMLIGRFAVILPALSIAGSLVSKKIAPVSGGTFSTDTPIFAILLAAVIVIVGALTFLPALSLGPIVEHLLLSQGKGF